MKGAEEVGGTEGAGYVFIVSAPELMAVRVGRGSAEIVLVVPGFVSVEESWVELGVAVDWDAPDPDEVEVDVLEVALEVVVDAAAAADDALAAALMRFGREVCSCAMVGDVNRDVVSVEMASLLLRESRIVLFICLFLVRVNDLLI